MEIEEPVDKPAWQKRKGKEISQQIGYIAEGLFRDYAEIANSVCNSPVIRPALPPASSANNIPITGWPVQHSMAETEAPKVKLLSTVKSGIFKVRKERNTPKLPNLKEHGKTFSNGWRWLSSLHWNSLDRKSVV